MKLDRFNSFSNTVKSYSACIHLAYIHSKRSNMDPNNEVYWYTRELCAEKLRELGVSVIDLISCYNKWPLSGVPRIDKATLTSAAGDTWYEVMHPDILVQDVLNE